MKTLTFIAGLLVATTAVAQLPPPEATQAETDAGVIGSKYISPRRGKNASWAGSGGGGGGTFTNVTVIQTNATTAQIQSAFDTGGTIWFTPSVYPYVMTTNISITNAVYVIGNNNLVQPGTGVSNFMWDTFTNTVTGGVYIDGLRFDGKVRNAFSVTSNLFSLLNGTPTIYYNPYWSNSSGLRVSSQSGGTIKNCQFFGWSGNGLMMVNALANNAHYFPRVEVAQSSFYSNFCGLYLPGSAYETAGYYNNSAPWVAASPEYQPVHQCTFTRNYMGLGGGASNGHLEENMFSDNQIGVHLTASVNSGAHGIYIGSTYNHNNYGFWAESVQLGRFNGNVLLANNNTAFIGSSITEAQISENWFTGGVIITNNSTGYFSRNCYQGSWSNTFASIITNAVTVCGNVSTTVAGNNDGISCNNSNITGTVTFPGTAVFTGSAIFGGSVTVSNGLPSYFSNLYTTNFTIFSNTPPAAPLTYGEIGFYNSNGVPYIMDSSLSGAHTWLTTSRFGSSPQQVATSLGGLPMNGSGITNLIPSRIVAGTGITTSTNNPGAANETLTISANGSSGSQWVNYMGASSTLFDGSAGAQKYFPIFGGSPYSGNASSQRLNVSRSSFDQTFTNGVVHIVGSSTGDAFGTGTNVSVFLGTNADNQATLVIVPTWSATLTGDGSTYSMAVSGSAFIPKNTVFGLIETNNIAGGINAKIVWNLNATQTVP